ncbi:MAG: hypothetical protein A2Y38_17220 [Spirochaetes bacterium GWB1_59_5]|nr:MAG: hypothetical protein A2Y38_17220 [Spirochaetes bacterium GWB1_59_5]
MSKSAKKPAKKEPETEKTVEPVRWPSMTLDNIHPSTTRNPNKMSDEKYELLKRGMELLGCLQPVLLAPSQQTPGMWETIDGHHRIKAATELEWTEILYVTSEKIDEEEMRRAIRLGMNNIRGEVDLAEAAVIIGELREEGWATDEMGITGFTEEELGDLLEASAKSADDVMNGQNEEPEDEPPVDPDKTFMIEIVIPDKETYLRLKRGLKRAAGKGNELHVGLAKLLGEEAQPDDL